MTSTTTAAADARGKNTTSLTFGDEDLVGHDEILAEKVTKIEKVAKTLAINTDKIHADVSTQMLDVQKQLVELTAAGNETSSKIKQLEKSIKDSNEKIAVLKAQISKLKSVNQELEAESNNKDGIISEKNIEIQNLRDSLAKLEAQVSADKKELEEKKEARSQSTVSSKNNTLRIETIVIPTSKGQKLKHAIQSAGSSTMGTVTSVLSKVPSRTAISNVFSSRNITIMTFATTTAFFGYQIAFTEKTTSNCSNLIFECEETTIFKPVTTIIAELGTATIKSAVAGLATLGVTVLAGKALSKLKTLCRA